MFKRFAKKENQERSQKKPKLEHTPTDEQPPESQTHRSFLDGTIREIVEILNAFAEHDHLKGPLRETLEKIQKLMTHIEIIEKNMTQRMGTLPGFSLIGSFDQLIEQMGQIKRRQQMLCQYNSTLWTSALRGMGIVETELSKAPDECLGFQREKQFEICTKWKAINAHCSDKFAELASTSISPDFTTFFMTFCD